MPPNERRAAGVSGIGIVLVLVCLAAATFLSHWTGVACAWLAVPVALSALLAWSFLWIHLRMRQSAVQEQRDLQALRERKKDASLFRDESGDQTELLTARTRLLQFEKLAVPFFSVSLGLLLMASCAWGWVVLLPSTKESGPSNALASLGFFAAMGLASFLMGRYASGLASERQWSLLRPGSSFTLAYAGASLLAVVGLAGIHFEAPLVERVVSYVLASLQGLVGVEILLNQLLDFYRPRVEGQVWRPAYDSRSLAILGNRTSLLRTLADTLDYQFGFQVSETWFYRFLQRAIAPLLLFQALALYLLTCLIVIGPGEQAVVETFGRRSSQEGEARVLGPGLHLKWPWPIQIAYREKTSLVREILLGRPKGEEYESKPDRLQAILWTSTHFAREYRFLMASERAGQEMRSADDSSLTVPVNMISGQITVHYRIKDIVQYLYGHLHPDQLVEDMAYRELVRYMAGEDLLHLLGKGRSSAGEDLQDLLQIACDQRNLGVEVVFVGLQDVHPPVVLPPGAIEKYAAPSSSGSVGSAFEGVVAAEAQKNALILEAEAYQAKTVTLAKAEAYQSIQEAEAYGTKRVSLAEADSDAFQNHLLAYEASPKVYRARKHLDSVECALSSARKYVLPSDAEAHEVTILDWEEKLRTDLLDLDFRQEETR